MSETKVSVVPLTAAWTLPTPEPDNWTSGWFTATPTKASELPVLTAGPTFPELTKLRIVPLEIDPEVVGNACEIAPAENATDGATIKAPISKTARSKLTRMSAFYQTACAFSEGPDGIIWVELRIGFTKMDQTEDLTESHDMINECSSDQWSSFEEVIKDMKPQDLAEIADRMSISGLTEDSLWEDYCKAFSDFEWYQFCDAFSRVMGRDFSLS